MFSILFNFYLNLSLICILTTFLPLIMTKLNIGNNPDVWKLLKEIQESIEAIEDENIRVKMTNFMNVMIEFPENAIMFMIAMSCLPILHIFVLKSNIKVLFDRFKEED
jgi:hypothetical protein